MTALPSGRIDQVCQISPPAKQEDGAYDRSMLRKCGELSVVAGYGPASEPVCFALIRIRDGERLVLFMRSCDQIGEYDVDQSMVYIELFGILEHISTDLQSLFGGSGRKRILIGRGFFRIGNVARVADHGVGAVCILGGQYETGVHPARWLRGVKRDRERHFFRFFHGLYRLHVLFDLFVRKRKCKKVAPFTSDLFGIFDGSCDPDFFGRDQLAAGDLCRL